jgi:hypothetical protein
MEGAVLLLGCAAVQLAFKEDTAKEVGAIGNMLHLLTLYKLRMAVYNQ